MKKSVFVLAIICFMTLTAQADVAKYCMSYSDFVAGNWKSVDELTEGRELLRLRSRQLEIC